MYPVEAGRLIYTCFDRMRADDGEDYLPDELDDVAKLVGFLRETERVPEEDMPNKGL